MSDSQKNVGTSTSKFLPGGVCDQCNGSPSPPGTLRWMGYPPPPRAQDKHCRSIEKQESSRTSSQNVAMKHSVWVFINLHPRPPGGPFVLGIKMERSSVSQPRQGIEHNTPSSCSRTFAPAPSAFDLCIMFHQFYYCITCAGGVCGRVADSVHSRSRL